MPSAPFSFPFTGTLKSSGPWICPQHKESANLAINVNLLHQRLGHIGHQSACSWRVSWRSQLRALPATAPAASWARAAVPAISKSTRFAGVRAIGTGAFRLCRAISYSSLGGAKYAQIVIDSYSAVATVSFHQTKEATLHAAASTTSSSACHPCTARLKAIRTDCGGEFAAEFDARCLELRIMHQLAPSHTQQLNGKAERALQTIIQHASCMLQHGKSASVSLGRGDQHGMLPVQQDPSLVARDGLTPFEALMGFSPASTTCACSAQRVSCTCPRSSGASSSHAPPVRVRRLCCQQACRHLPIFNPQTQAGDRVFARRVPRGHPGH